MSHPSELYKFIDFCCQIDQRIYLRKQKRSAARRSSKTSSSVSFSPKIYYNSTETLPSPMEIGSISKGVYKSLADETKFQTNRKKVSAEELEHRMKNNLCRYCGAKDHKLAFCPKKKVKHANSVNCLEASSNNLTTSSSSPSSSSRFEISISIQVNAGLHTSTALDF